jgi:serine phosphatase RsbU (regulator of sigma subunit)
LGVVRSAPANRSTSVEVECGATLVFYTDGLVERRDLAIDEALSRLRASVESAPPVDLEAFLDRLVDFAAGGVDDDVAILAVEIPAGARGT